MLYRLALTYESVGEILTVDLSKKVTADYFAVVLFDIL